MKKLLWALLLTPAFLNAQGLIEAPLEKRIEDTIKQYNKEKLPGYFIPVFGIFVRPENTLLFNPEVNIPSVTVMLELKFFRYKPEFGFFRVSLGIPALPNISAGSSVADKYGKGLRVGLSLGGGYHILDTRNEKTGQGHALSLMGSVLWECYGGPNADFSFYNGLGLEFETRYQYNINAFSAFALGFFINYKGLFYSLNTGNNIIDKGHGLSYGAVLGFLF